MYEFLPLQVKSWHWFCILQNSFWEFRKTGKHCKYFCILKISCQSKESRPFLDNPTFIPTPPFLEKILHPHPYCQIRGTQSPFIKRAGWGGGGLNYVLFLFFIIDWIWVRSVYLHWKLVLSTIAKLWFLESKKMQGQEQYILDLVNLIFLNTPTLIFKTFCWTKFLKLAKNA